MSTWADWERELRTVNTNLDENFYQPELHVTGSTRPFRPAPVPVVIPRPATVAGRPGPEGDFLAGLSLGFALSLPIWFALTALALFLAGR